jgi:hypothetical protein
MREEIKTAIEAISSHPKSAVIVAGAFNFNAWYGTYEPIAKFATSILGIVLVSVLIVKHVIELRETLRKGNSDDSKTDKENK